MLDVERLTEQEEIDLVVGFFDLQLYAKWGAGRRPKELLELADSLFARTGQQISDAGGKLVKAIGDAGLFVFTADAPDGIVASLRQMKRDCDEWLAGRGYPGAMVVVAEFGPVACGLIGPPGDERFDVYGTTVNSAAMMRGHEFAVGAGLANLLDAKTRTEFTELEDGSLVEPG